MLRHLARCLTRRPSPARKAPRARRWQPSLEELESRLVPTVLLNIQGGVLTFQGDSASDTVTVDHVVLAGKGFAEINDQFFSDASYSSIRINGGTGGTVTNIHGNVKPLSVFGDSTKDVVNLGDTSNKLQGIQATVLMEDEKGFSGLVNINDQGDSALHTVALSTVPRAGGTSLGQVSGLGAAAIQWDYHDTSAVNLHLGTGASQVNVLGTGMTTSIFNSANATINVGSGGSVAGIQGALNLENETAAKDTVFINDQSDATTRSVTVSTIVRAGDTSLGAVNGLGAAPITWDYHDTAAVNLNLGRGASQVNVQGTGVTTNIFNSAAAAILVTNAGSVAGIQGALNLANESAAKDSVTIFDQNDTATRTATVSTIARTGDSSLGAVNGLGNAQITWDYKNTVVVSLFLGTGARTVNVNGTGPLSTDISIIAPNATLNVGNGNVAANIRGVLNLLTRASGAAVNILDQNDTQGQNAVLTTSRFPNQSLGQLSRLGSSSIVWDYLGTSSVNIVGGSGDDTFNIVGTVVPTSVKTNGPATINVGDNNSLAGIQGSLTLESNSGRNNTVSILSENDSPKTEAVLNSVAGGDSSSGLGTFFVAGLSTTIRWDNADTSAVNLDLGSGTVDVLKTGVTTHIINNGNATIGVGDSTGLAGIHGALNLENLAGSDVLEIFDQADTTSPSVTLDTLPGNEGQITGLSALITFQNDEVSELDLNLGPATSQVFVLAAGAFRTFIVNSADANILVGSDGSVAGSLAGIQSFLFLLNSNGNDNVSIDNSGDGVSETFNLDTFPSFGTTVGQFFGTAMTGGIGWDTARTAHVNIFGGIGSDTYFILDTGVPTTLVNDANATINVGDTNNSLAGIQGALELLNEGGQNAFDNIIINDQGDTSSPSVTLDTLAGNVGRITGLSAPITFGNDQTSQLVLNLGPATSTDIVNAVGTNTFITNNGDATVHVGNGTLTAIQHFLELNNANGSDTIFINDAQDSTGRLFGLTTFAGPGIGGATTFGEVFGFDGTTHQAFITWDNATTTSVTLFGGSGGNTFNVFATDVPITIFGGAGENRFNIDPLGQELSLGAFILGPLIFHGGGNANTGMFLFEQHDPSHETFHFDIPQFGTGTLTLGSNPLFNLAFDGMNSFVDLRTNGFSTVDAPPGTVDVIS
jgi:hypothetical protein